MRDMFRLLHRYAGFPAVPSVALRKVILDNHKTEPPKSMFSVRKGFIRERFFWSRRLIQEWGD